MDDDQKTFERGVRHILSTVRGMIDSALTSRLGNILTGNKINATALPLGSGLGISGGQVVATGGTGTVTSVGITAPAIFSVSGSPVTGSGSITISLATEISNTVWAGPTTGVAATPTFRGLVPADIPSLDAAKIATGTFSTARIPIMVGSGASHAPGAVPDPPSTAGITKFLREDGTWATISGGGVSDATTTATGVGLADRVPASGHPVLKVRLNNQLGSSSASAQPFEPIDSVSLLDRLRGGIRSYSLTGDILEFDFQYYNGNYHQAWHNGSSTSLKGPSVDIPTLFASSNVATIATLYPSLYFDGSIWHLYGWNSGTGHIQHWTCATFNGTYVVADSCTGIPAGAYDPQARQSPDNGKFYMGYTATGTPGKVGIAVADGPGGPWTDLGLIYSVIGDPGFCADQFDPCPVFWHGRSYMFYSGGPNGTSSMIMGVELSPDTMKAIGSTVMLINADDSWQGTNGANNPIWLAVPNQPGQERVYYVTATGTGYLQIGLPPCDGRRAQDMLRMDATTGYDHALMYPGALHHSAEWSSAGLVVPSGGGAYGPLCASGFPGDFTLIVEFTPAALPTAGNTARLILLYTGTTAADPIVSIAINGSTGALTGVSVQDVSHSIIQDGSTPISVGTRYVAVLRRFGNNLNLYVNGVLDSGFGTQTQSFAISGLTTYALGNDGSTGMSPADPFAGTIHGAVAMAEALQIDLIGFSIGPSVQAATLAGDADVSVSAPVDTDLLVYRASDDMWHNIQPTDPGTIRWEPAVLSNTGGTAPIFVVNGDGKPIMVPVAN